MARSHVIVAGVLILAVAGNAWAESSLFGPSSRTQYWEFSVQTRYVASQDFEGRGGSGISTEDDLGWGFNVGYNINERLNIGGFISWRTVGYSAHIVDAENADNRLDYSGWLDTSNLALNATWNVLANRFTPYLQGSVGWAMVDTNIPADVEYACWWDPWYGYICDMYGANYGEDAAAFTLGAGVSWQLTDIFCIHAGYEKLWLDADVADDFDIFRLDLGFMYR